VSIEARVQRLEDREPAETCPHCGSHRGGVVQCVIRPHDREGGVPEDEPVPAGYRPHRQPPTCPGCGQPEGAVRELYEDALGVLWEAPDRVQHSQEDATTVTVPDAAAYGTTTAAADS
jgi:hypothetical protein